MPVPVPAGVEVELGCELQESGHRTQYHGFREATRHGQMTAKGMKCNWRRVESCCSRVIGDWDLNLFTLLQVFCRTFGVPLAIVNLCLVAEPVDLALRHEVPSWAGWSLDVQLLALFWG